ncbi:hypothetical protein ZIOFF_031835 [Zingiber officinale]|uniref:WAT1-related protein n=1 Tax=Zingiber officinale TaxID=94328 RepID=A0A8J5LB58_ZINOF|nr:hypothetical protein ZIOFF_031835 [Zingiber officinale]
MASVKACAPYFYMIVSQFTYAGSNILGKLALGQGLSALVFVVYRHLIAMLILAPLAYVLERNRRPSFSFGVMLKISILAMLGITIQQNVYYVGLHLISPTVASALGNAIPAFTFLLAIVLRMEKLNLKTVRGRAKLAGAIFCITGSLIFTFWKGDAWLKGSALMLFGYFACSVSLVLQYHSQKTEKKPIATTIIPHIMYYGSEEGKKTICHNNYSSCSEKGYSEIYLHGTTQWIKTKIRTLLELTIH